MHDHSILTRLLEHLTRGLLRARRTVLVVCVLSAVLSVAIAVQWLGFRTSRLDLLNPQSDYNRRWLEYLSEFGNDDDVLVVVAGADADSITPALDALAAELARQPDMFQNVLARSDLARLRPKGLHFVPEPDLRKLVAYVEYLEPLAQGDARVCRCRPA